MVHRVPPGSRCGPPYLALPGKRAHLEYLKSTTRESHPIRFAQQEVPASDAQRSLSLEGPTLPVLATVIPECTDPDPRWMCARIAIASRAARRPNSSWASPAYNASARQGSREAESPPRRIRSAQVCRYCSHSLARIRAYSPDANRSKSKSSAGSSGKIVECWRHRKR